MREVVTASRKIVVPPLVAALLAGETGMLANSAGSFTYMADPAKAPKKRTMITSDKEVASPQGMIRTMKSSVLAM